MEPVERFKVGDKEVLIYQDENPSNPRDDDNLGIIYYCNGRYALGDECLPVTEIQENVDRCINRGGVVLPVFAYIHSGITITTNTDRNYPFNCPWDSGQCGVIIAPIEKILKNFIMQGITPGLKDRARTVLADEIKTFDQYLRGDIYGFTIIQKKTCEQCKHTEEEVLESCWGFYGLESCKEEAKRNTS